MEAMEKFKVIWLEHDQSLAQEFGKNEKNIQMHPKRTE